MEQNERPDAVTPSSPPETSDPVAPTSKPPVDNTDPDVPLGAGLDLADPNSPLAPLYLRIGHIVALGLVILFAFYVRLLPLTGRGLWSALALGRSTVENSQVPTHDPLSSFSDPNAPLPASGWLGRTALYLVYRAGAGQTGNLASGVEALRFTHGFLSVALCFLALAVFTRRTSSSAWGSLGLALLIPAAPLLFGNLTTQMLGLLCFAALLALFAKEELTWRSTIFAPLLLLLWASLDSSFVLGLAFLGLLSLGQLIESARSRRTVLLLTALTASVLLCFLTPDGPALFLRLYRWSARPGTADLSFFQAMNFSEWKTIHYVFLATLASLTLAAAFSRRAYTPREMSVLLGFCVLTLWKQGAAAWWFLLVPWLLLPPLAELGKQLWPDATPGQADLRKTFVGALLGLAALIAILPVNWIRDGKPRPLSVTLAPDVPWPVAATLLQPRNSELLPALSEHLRKEYGGEFTGVLYGSEGANDFLLFVLREKMPVMVYSDPGLFPERHWREYRAIRTTRADWWELLDKHGVNLIVLTSTDDSSLGTALEDDPAWTIVNDGKPPRPWLVAIRKSPVRRGPK